MTGELPPQWQDRIPELDRAQASIDAAAINSFQRDFARRGDGNPHRAFHVKSHAGLHGTLRILPDLPAVARHGIFAEPRDFSALVRLSNGFSATKPDWFPDLVGLAVKVEGVDGDKLLPGEAPAATQDFLALDRGHLPVDHPGHLMVISLATGNLLTAPFKLLRGLGMAKGLEVIFWTIGCVAAAAVPEKRGDHRLFGRRAGFGRADAGEVSLAAAPVRAGAGTQSRVMDRLSA